jgi:two-component system LytT family response regulator
VRERLTALHRRLDPNRFVRIHRSAVVNVSRVTNVQPYHYGDLTLLLTTGRQLRVSRTRRRALEAALGQRL